MNLGSRSLATAACLAAVCCVATAARAGDGPVGRHGFWSEVRLGGGALARESDEEARVSQGTFALAFTAGGTVSRHLRVGGELGGWLIDAFDWWDPAKGASVSHALAVVQWYPSERSGLFVKAGAGRATYTTHPAETTGSSGWGGTIGVGYDVPVHGAFSLTPAIHCSAGSLGGVGDSIHRRVYAAVDAGVALSYR